MALRINENSRNESIEEFPVRVTITHGDLGHSRFPVAVGHHKGDGIVSAERVLDRYLNGHLSEKHKMGIYPGEIETSEILLECDNNPPGGVVVGLGNFGELNLGSFTRTMSHAILDLAMNLKEHSDHSELHEEVSPSGISPLLIGSGFGGLTVRSSIKGILSGLRAANKIISELGIEGVRQIEEIEFVEIYEDRAIQAARILHQIINDEQYKIFTLPDPYIRKVPGGRRRVIEMPEEDWWHRLKVDGLGGGDDKKSQHLVPLHFTSLTDRARAVVSNLATQRALVDQLVEESVSKIDWEVNLSQTMFELLIPNDFKEYAAEKRNILWILDKKSAEYPWELLYDPSLGEKEPMAIRSGMLRQLSVAEYRMQTTPAEPWAMIVGDTISDFSALPGAQKEARIVSSTLKASGLEVVELIQKSASEILTALFKHKYRVLHLATHGVFDFGESGITGMVLDKDSFLTPAEIKQMRYIPELVFINCCHLGKVSSEQEHLSTNRNKLAANLGTQLIQMGVKAVIVAGWAVHDGAAEAFSSSFYKKMKSGENFGTAVLEARTGYFKIINNLIPGEHTNVMGTHIIPLFQKVAKSGIRKSNISIRWK